jgi:hypothetical protein
VLAFFGRPSVDEARRDFVERNGDSERDRQATHVGSVNGPRN